MKFTRTVIQDYYRLAKPGIVYGNLFTATAGFLLGAQGNVAFGLLAATMVGISLIMASACVINNYIDRGIDSKMTRTKNRALVTGRIQKNPAFIYAGVLGIAGFSLLAFFTNLLTVVLGLIALFTYVALYGAAKRRSVHGTLVGSIAGSLPPVAGYTAATNRFDGGAILLFLIMTVWQMPHFYAIATYRQKEYANAGLPVLTVKKGVAAAKFQIVAYVCAYLVLTQLLSVFGYTSFLYSVVMAVVGLLWLRLVAQGLQTNDNERWARKVFGFSLIVLLTFSLTIALDSFLP